MAAVNEAGFRLEVHVIGDRAAEAAIEAFEKAQITPEKRPILTHCQVGSCYLQVTVSRSKAYTINVFYAHIILDSAQGPGRANEAPRCDCQHPAAVCDDRRELDQ